MMSAYCDRAGKTLGEVRFMFGLSRLSHFITRLTDASFCATDGNKIQATDTVSDVSGPADRERLDASSNQTDATRTPYLTPRSSTSTKKRRRSPSTSHPRLCAPAPEPAC